MCVRFWKQCSQIAGAFEKENQIQRKISLNDFGGNEAEFMKTEEAQILFELEKANALRKENFSQQAGALFKQNALMRSYISLFQSSKRGLGIINATCPERPRNKQQGMRKNMIKAYEAADPDPTTSFVWDPVLWRYSSNTIASHLFAYAQGQETMTAIFGPMDPPELFSPRNGLLLSKEIEDVFDIGFLTIVPKINDIRSKSEVISWSNSEPKQYMVKILDFSNPIIGKKIKFGMELIWRDLDGRELKFKNDFRPRSRYLYYHYCLQTLRFSWRVRAPMTRANTLIKEKGKVFWGTFDKQLPKHMLEAFVQELGQEYEELLQQGADVEEIEGDKYLLNTALTRHVKVSHGEKLEMGDTDSEDDVGFDYGDVDDE